MESDDGFGDLCTDVLRPFAASVPSPAGSAAPFPNLPVDPDGDAEEILHGATDLNSSISDSTKLKAPIEEKTLIPQPEIGRVDLNSNSKALETIRSDGLGIEAVGPEEGEAVKLSEDDNDLNIVVEDKENKGNGDMVSLSDSPAPSSGSDDFAAFLDDELDIASNAPSSSDDLAAFLDGESDKTSNASSDDSLQVWEEERDDADEESYDLDLKRVKRRKVELSEDDINLQSSVELSEDDINLQSSVELSQDVINPQSSASQGELAEATGSSSKKNVCPPHPGVVAGMCVRCGQNVEEESGVPLEYIHKGFRFSNDEIARVRDKDFKNLLRNKKLYLVLDLDHTLLNSARLPDITMEEGYLHGQRDAFPDSLKSSLFRIEWMQMMTKLRPFVHTLLKEANDLFEMSIYTMGERPYALEMAKLLDPSGIYFNSRIIAQGDCTKRHQKGLDVVLGQESAVIILDDTESVWGKHKENLILMERYNFFASSCKQFGFSNCKSLSELKSDESESEGALATVLRVLQRVHSIFFDEERKDKLEDRDVRQVLKSVKSEVLKGCKLVFTRVIPTNSRAEQHPIWKMAEQLGATFSVEVDESVTHVVSVDRRMPKSSWAVREGKHLVHPRWIEASNYMWRKQPEEKFPVVDQSKRSNDV